MEFLFPYKIHVSSKLRSHSPTPKKKKNRERERNEVISRRCRPRRHGNRPSPPLEHSDTISLRRNRPNSTSHPHRIDFTHLFLPETLFIFTFFIVFRRRRPEDEDRYSCKNGRRSETSNRRHNGRK